MIYQKLTIHLKNLIVSFKISIINQHELAGELSWLERGTHKPEGSGSIPLPATTNRNE